MPEPLASLGIAEVAGAALFATALGVLVWPMARRIVEAHRQRASALRVVHGEHGPEK